MHQDICTSGFLMWLSEAGKSGKMSIYSSNTRGPSQVCYKRISWVIEKVANAMLQYIMPQFLGNRTPLGQAAEGPQD